jgi:RNA polymerase sigma-70 factor (ECF subfamily)
VSIHEESLARLFEGSRPHLQAVAFRMLGSVAEADDAVQEAWLRLSRSDTAAVDNLTGWLTTVVARICLDALRSRKTKGEAPPATVDGDVTATDPERETVMAESVGLALLVVLQALTPPERIAFVLHDLFGVPFEEIAAIVGRSPDAARQLASRARRRVQGGEVTTTAPEAAEQRRLVEAFLQALRAHDFDGLVAVLGPEFVARADASASPPTGREVRGRETWGKQAIAFGRGVRGLHTALAVAIVDGSFALVFAPQGRLQRVLIPSFADGRIASVDIVADPARIQQLEVSVVLDGAPPGSSG